MWVGEGVRDGLTVWATPRSTLRVPQAERPHQGMDSGSGAGMMGGRTCVFGGGRFPNRPYGRGWVCESERLNYAERGEGQGRFIEVARSYNGMSENVIQSYGIFAGHIVAVSCGD